MKILLVEDDEHKRNDVAGCLLSLKYDISVDYGYSVESGVQKAVDNNYDLLLLDMTIPNFDQSNGSSGGRSFKKGGELIVEELLDMKQLTKLATVFLQYVAISTSAMLCIVP